MATKIYRKSNYIFVEKDARISVPDHSSKVNVYPTSLIPGSEKYTIESPKIGRMKSVNLTDLIDENDVPYTLSSWTTFYTVNTGFNTDAGGRVSVNVTQENLTETLGGVIDSNVLYTIDGIIDMCGISIEVPVGGINLRGLNFNVSKLICSSDNYTMFTSPVGGSGDFLGTNYAVEVTGVNSKVYELIDATGFSAVEFNTVNYNNCTSLGSFENYRQGLESGSGRFGGKPELELIGTWVGGFRITTSIIRGLEAGSYSLFKAGLGFSMDSRFLTDINCDLPVGVSFCDFVPTNFTAPSLLQVIGAIFTRSGLSVPEDPLFFPNISHKDIQAVFKDCQGVKNTFEGGDAIITTEQLTTINTIGVFETLAGTFTTNNLQHFDSPANGQLRHLGNNPREYSVICDLILESTSNDVLIVRVMKYDASEATISEVYRQTRQVNNLAGGRDVAFFDIFTHVLIDMNDYVYLEVANEGATNNITAELDSYMDVEKR